MIRTRVPLCFLAALAVVLVGAPAATADISALEVREYQRDFDVSNVEAEANLEAQRRGTQIVDLLKGTLGERYAGVWFDNESGEFVVPLLDGVDRGTVAKVLATIGLANDFRTTPADASWKELEVLHDNLDEELYPRIGAGVAQTLLDPRTNSVVVREALGANKVEKAEIADVARDKGAEVEVRGVEAVNLGIDLKACTTSVPRKCDAPLRGGVTIEPDYGKEGWGYEGVCSAGFKAIDPTTGDRYVLTAGHCNSATWWQSQDSSGKVHGIGQMVASTFPNGDWAKIKANGSYWDTNPWPSMVAHYWEDQERPIKYEGNSYVGQYVCHSGNTTGTSCGSVLTLDFTGEVGPGQYIHNMTEFGEICVAEGDSGGSVFSGVTAMGIFSATNDAKPGVPNGSCGNNVGYGLYLEITEATTAMDVTVGTNPLGSCDLGGLGDRAPGPRPIIECDGTRHVFFRTPSGGLGHNWYIPGGSGWGSEVLAGSLASEPHPVVDRNGWIYVFYRTPSGGLGHTWYNPGAGAGGWGSPGWGSEVLAGSVSGEPHPVLDENWRHVFYRTPSGGLGHTYYNPGAGAGGWGSPGWANEALPGSIASEPHPVFDKNGWRYVYYRTPSGALGQTYYNPGAGAGGWGSPGWANDALPGSVGGEPHPVFDITGWRYVYYRTPSGALGQTYYNPGAGAGGWGSPGWANDALPGSLAGEPHPVIDDAGWLGWRYVYYRTPSGGLGHTYYNPGAGAGGWGSPSWTGEVLAGSVAARPPAVSTGAATGVVTAGAQLEGTANPEGSPAAYHFEYGTTTSYGSKKPVSGKGIGNGIDAAAVSETISGLTPNTLYHYRLVATSPEGTTNGTDKTFVTAASGVAGKLPAMPVTEPFNGDAASLARFNADWSALGWAAGANPKGSNTTTGWRPVDAYPTVNGAFSKSTITDAGTGTAAVATMAVNPGSSNHYFSLWLDASGSASTRSGYELRFTYVSANTYDVSLSKWQSGAQTVLATKSGYTFANGNSLALVDSGAAVSAWTNTGSGFNQLLSAGDAAFSSGNAGLAGAGNSTRLTKFKAGALPSLGGKFATSSSWTTWSTGYSMDFADVNADGRADIVGRHQSTGAVEVGLSTGSKFNSSTQWTGWSIGYSIRFADVNADGRADIIGRNNLSGDVQVGLNTGTKFATSSAWADWPQSYSMDLADANKDGKADLVGRNSSTGDVRVALSTGSSFSSAPSWTTWSTAYSVDFADVHADGRADITGINSSGDVQVALSTGSAFGVSSSWISWPSAYSTDFADVNGDGHADIAGRNNGTGEVKVGLSSGTSFNSGTQWAPSWSLGFSMHFADVNADGRADLIGRNQTNGEVQVALSTGL